MIGCVSIHFVRIVRLAWWTSLPGARGQNSTQTQHKFNVLKFSYGEVLKLSFFHVSAVLTTFEVQHANFQHKFNTHVFAFGTEKEAHSLDRINRKHVQKDVSPTRQCSALTAMFIRERGELSTLRATMSSKPRYAVGLKRSDVYASGRDEKKCLERSHMTVSEANGTPHLKNTPVNNAQPS